MNKRTLSTLFFAVIAEMDLVVKNLINIFFVSRYIGAEGAAAYELVMPCVMLASAFVALSYNGVQTVCARDYGAGDLNAFNRHKNAGYTWILLIMAALTLFFAAFRAPVLDLLGANEGSRQLALLSRDCCSIFLLCFIPQGIFSVALCLLYFEERRQLLASAGILYACMLLGDTYVAYTEPSMTGFMAVNVVSASAADLYLILSCFILRRKSSLAAFTAFQIRPADIRDIFLTGLPDFLEYGFTGIVYLVENIYILSRFSESLVAGVGVFEAIDNLPEILCVGFAFLVTATLGTRVGRLISASDGADSHAARVNLDAAARQLTRRAVLGGLAVTVILILFARPMAALFLTDQDPTALDSTVLLTVSCALGFVFYLLNSELVCYFKIISAYKYAHILYFSEALLFPLLFKLGLGEIFGVAGFCMARFAAELFTFLLNLCLVWKAAGHFPLRVSDFRMDPILQRLIRQHREAEQ